MDVRDQDAAVPVQLIRGRFDILRRKHAAGTLASLEEEQGIYRDEVQAIIGGLADISTDTLRILAILRGEDEEEEDEDEEVES